MLKADFLIYALALLLGLGAGLTEITVGDLLVTALFVLLSTLVLGFVRPERAWRWILVVCAGVPLARLAAYLLLSQKSYKTEIWESALGFVTGSAGAYCGAFARRSVDELFRSH
ncbi:MAG: hypothetical protein JO159_14660 [Acidobacteria bacterium]|nr:hypothetical protein [Acidobacteriota bacterium]MBV9624114.1 hypothetical protein [Acidobacteriota bacterium]